MTTMRSTVALVWCAVILSLSSPQSCAWAFSLSSWAAAVNARLPLPKYKANGSLPLPPTEDHVESPFVPPSFDKTADEVSFITRALLGNSVCQGVPDLPSMVSAFEPVQVRRDTEIVRQGDARADYLYVVRNGTCAVSVDGRRLPDPYGTLGAGLVFGELAMLYRAPRAATVSAATACALYRLDRRTFRRFADRRRPREREDLKAALRDVDAAIDRIAGVTTRYGGSIVTRSRPDRAWIWRQWKGTVLQHAYKFTLCNMAVTAAISCLVRRRADCAWPLATAPDPTHVVIGRMALFGEGWDYLLSLTTFILTFFLGQAFSLWRDVTGAARTIQGQLHNIGLLLATSASRTDDGRLTPAASRVLDDVAGLVRLFHVFLWASISSSLGVLLTRRGMARMLGRGLLTPAEFRALRGAEAGGCGAHHACLEWIVLRAGRGMRDADGGLDADPAVKIVLLERACELRGAYEGIGSTIAGRMPLAYLHLVQILVDTFLVTAPVALYARAGVWSVFSVGVLTLFYSGLLDLAKIFLDPLDNANIFNDSVNFDIGVLIREVNAGSTRWKGGATNLPF